VVEWAKGRGPYRDHRDLARGRGVRVIWSGLDTAPSPLRSSAAGATRPPSAGL